jgi:membrane fusion protein, multidrug efflux system
MKRLISVIIFLAVSGGLTWLVWFRPVKEPGEPKEPEALVPVHVGKVTGATLRGYVTAYGPVEPEPKASARVAPAVPGVVAVVQCAEGQRVERGAPLFQLDSRAADVAVSFAQKSLERQQKLAKVEGTSQKLLQEAELALAAARAQQALLRIESPIAGVVTKVNVKAGEAADLTTVLAEVVDLDHLTVSVNVSSAELASLKPGQPAEVTCPELTNAINTTLSFASPHVDAKTGSGLARVALPAPGGLRPGQFVKVRIVSEEHKDCLAVPLASVVKDLKGNTYVALVEGAKDSETAWRKSIKVGLRDGDLVEVEGDGVEADKTVVTEGAYGIIMTDRDATKVRVVND